MTVSGVEADVDIYTVPCKPSADAGRIGFNFLGSSRPQPDSMSAESNVLEYVDEDAKDRCYAGTYGADVELAPGSGMNGALLGSASTFSSSTRSIRRVGARPARAYPCLAQCRSSRASTPSSTSTSRRTAARCRSAASGCPTRPDRRDPALASANLALPPPRQLHRTFDLAFRPSRRILRTFSFQLLLDPFEISLHRTLSLCFGEPQTAERSSSPWGDKVDPARSPALLLIPPRPPASDTRTSTSTLAMPPRTPLAALRARPRPLSTLVTSPRLLPTSSASRSLSTTAHRASVKDYAAAFLHGSEEAKEQIKEQHSKLVGRHVRPGLVLVLSRARPRRPPLSARGHGRSAECMIGHCAGRAQAGAGPGEEGVGAVAR